MHSQNCISQTNAINFLLFLQYGEITSVGVQILFFFLLSNPLVLSLVLAVARRKLY
jgi:hypothetical protein